LLFSLAMKQESIQFLSNSDLLRFAEQVGGEIDRRWNRGSGRKSDSIKTCTDVFARFHYRLWQKRQEHLYLLMLDQQHSLIEERLISLGTVNASLVHAREIFAPAIHRRATAIILVHNHPTGNAQPSPEDMRVTKGLKKVGDLIGIPLLDHIIVGKYQYYSDSMGRVIF
jgi:DNA repair protein RadC